MHLFPVPTLFVQMDAPGATAWADLQRAVGSGMLTAVVETPETHGAHPLSMEIREHPDAPVHDLAAATQAFDALTFTWRRGIERLLNGRWNLVDNPYARFTVVQGAVLCHEDTLDWLVDRHADELADTRPLDHPICAVLVPLPSSQHGQLAAAAHPVSLRHDAILTGILTQAALDNGHTSITPLAWAPQPGIPSDVTVLAL